MGFSAATGLKIRVAESFGSRDVKGAWLRAVKEMEYRVVNGVGYRVIQAFGLRMYGIGRSRV